MPCIWWEQVVCRQMFDTKFNFDSSFHVSCQSLNRHLFWPWGTWSWMERTSSTRFNLWTQLLQLSLTVSQLLIFNSVKCTWVAKSLGTVHQSHEPETSFPLYVALKVHAVTCKRGIIDTLQSGDVCHMIASCKCQLTLSTLQAWRCCVPTKNAQWSLHHSCCG